MVKKTDTQHPESLDKVKQIKPTQDLISFVNELKQDIDDEKSSRARWELAIDRLQKLRYGVRRPKNHPWPGAANYMIPQIDSDIAKVKPSYVNLVYAINPIVTFEPFGPEDVEPAKKRELLFDWRMRTKVKFFKPLNYGLDQILGSQGQTVFRNIWKFTTRTYTEIIDLSELDEDVIDAMFDARLDDEMFAQGILEEFRVDLDFDENLEEARNAVKKLRNGSQRVELTFLEKKDNQVEVIACDIKDDLTIPADTKDLNDARFIDYKFWISKNDTRISMKDGKYEKFPDHEIDSWSNKSVNTGITINKFRQKRSEDMILMHETCCWYDVDDDGIDERCVVTWPDSDSGKILRFIELPYEHGMWPYVQIKRELTENGFYASRGYPSLEEDFQVGISTSVNQAIDNGTILNSPFTISRKGVISNPKNRKYIPGEHIETTGPITDYDVRSVGNNTQGVLFQQAQFLKSWADNRLGQQTTGLGSQTDLPGLGSRGKKTKAEVDALIAIQGQAQSLDLQVFQQQIAILYYQIDSLYNQFGDEEEEILITNEQPIKISRAETQGKFNIIPNGRIDNSSPDQRLRKLLLAVNFATENPGIIKQEELARAVMKEIDPRYDRFVYTAEEMQQLQQAQINAKEQAEADALEKTVGIKMTMDDTDVLKEAKLLPIQGKKFAPD